MTVLEQETLAVVKAAAKQYIKQSDERMDIDRRMAAVAEKASAEKQVNWDAVWEQRRYEIAKDALAAEIMSKDDYSDFGRVQKAVEYADSLIKQLKGGQDND